MISISKAFKVVRPLDVLLFVTILAWAIFITAQAANTSNDKVVVHAANDVYEFSLNEDGVHQVHGALGITTIEIKDGRVRITDSPCPNKTCIRQGFAKPLVCLPNKVIVNIEESEGYDAIAE